jgi:hypothetical protein
MLDDDKLDVGRSDVRLICALSEDKLDVVGSSKDEA